VEVLLRLLTHQGDLVLLYLEQRSYHLSLLGGHSEINGRTPSEAQTTWTRHQAERELG
jgi:hypothetical protein